MNLCLPCAELVADQMELSPDQPSAGIDTRIWQCRSCGTTRACRDRWRTRCHACLDERTVLSGIEGLAQEWLATEPDELATIQQRNGWGPADMPSDEYAHVLLSARDYAAELAFYERPGWTVLAADVKGLPWGLHPGRRMSHGTWGRHEACGAVQNMRPIAECSVCEPEPGSRTHRARANRPYLLYLVEFSHPELGMLTKYGVGDRERVRDHLGRGCTPRLVLRSVHHAVVSAEQKLRVRHRDHALGAVPGMPPTFGRGREVVTAERDVDLRSVLQGAGVTDVTDSLAFLTGSATAPTIRPGHLTR